ncbi:MAG: substrate-binding domain-containing protein [Acetobacteraceae bacterium]
MKALLMVMAAMIGCGVHQARAADFSRAKIDVIVKAATSRYGAAVFDGARQAARDLGLSVAMLGAQSERDAAQEVQILKNATAAKPTGIVIAPADPRALAPPIAAATKAGIPVIVIDSAANTKDYAALLATDDEAAGKRAAGAMEHCVRRRRGKAAGEVAYLTALAGSRPLGGRYKGFVEGLKRFPRLKVAVHRVGKDNAARALPASERLLAGDPDLVGIFVDDGVEVDGASMAFAKMTRADRVCLVAFGASRQRIAFVRAGLIDALLVQNPYMMGYAGVWYALAAAHGVVLPKYVDTGASVVTEANIDTRKIAGLLDPGKYVLSPFLGAP